MPGEEKPFSYAIMAKKGAVYAATYTVTTVAGYLAAQGVDVTPGQKAALIGVLAGCLGAALTMLKNKAKMKWPDKLSWL